MINPEQAFTRAFFRRNWLILGILLAGGLAFGTLPVVYGILAGGLVAIGSFYWLNRSLKILLNPQGGASRFWMQVFSLLKVVMIGLILVVLITRFQVSPLGLLIGLSVIVLNVFYVTIQRILTGDFS